MLLVERASLDPRPPFLEFAPVDIHLRQLNFHAIGSVKPDPEDAYRFHNRTRGNDDARWGRVGRGRHGNAGLPAVQYGECCAGRHSRRRGERSEAGHDGEPMMIADAFDDRVPTDEEHVHEWSGYGERGR